MHTKPKKHLPQNTPKLVRVYQNQSKHQGIHQIEQTGECPAVKIQLLMTTTQWGIDNLWSFEINDQCLNVITPCVLTDKVA